jgi:hypothetical protein
VAAFSVDEVRSGARRRARTVPHVGCGAGDIPCERRSPKCSRRQPGSIAAWCLSRTMRCRERPQASSAGPAIRGSDLARAVLLPFAGRGVLVSVVEVFRLVMGDVNSWLQVGVVAAALRLTYAGLLLPAWRRGVAA